MTTEKRISKTERLINEAENIDYSAIAAMLCGRVLNPDQQKEVEKFNENYDEIKSHRQKMEKLTKNWK